MYIVNRELDIRTKRLRNLRREFVIAFNNRETSKLNRLREKIRIERQELLDIVNSIQ